MSFDQEVKQWIQADNELKEMALKMKTLREKRASLEKSLVAYANSNQLMNNTVKYSNVKLKFANTKVTEPLTFRYLENRLAEIIKNDEQRAYIIDYIKTKREYKMVPEIKRFG